MDLWFRAYLDSIRAKTGKTPARFKTLATNAGVYKLTCRRVRWWPG